MNKKAQQKHHDPVKTDCHSFANICTTVHEGEQQPVYGNDEEISNNEDYRHGLAVLVVILAVFFREIVYGN